VTYEEFQRHVGKAGLSLKEFAGLLRMNRASLSNLAKKGEVPAHLAIIATLLGEMAEQRVEFRPSLSRIDIKPKRARGTSLAAARKPAGEERNRGTGPAREPKKLGCHNGTK
jgi:hypothetical protein